MRELSRKPATDHLSLQVAEGDVHDVILQRAEV